MKFWLDIPCSELSREWLLDEHRSIHAYINGMLKNPNKWNAHILFGPMDPEVLFDRHEEEVREMNNRGYNHKSVVTIESVGVIKNSRIHLGISSPGEYMNKGILDVDLNAKYLQENYKRGCV